MLDFTFPKKNVTDKKGGRGVFRQTVAEENLNTRLNKVEHKFANIQIAFGFLSALKLRDDSKWRAKKNEDGVGIMLIQTFVLKVIKNERKK